MGLIDTALFLVAAWAFCIQKLRTSRLGSVTQAQLTSSNIMEPWALGAVRMVIGVFILGVTIPRLLSPPATTFCMEYGDPKPCVPYGGKWIITTFTIWCWTSQGVYFTTTGVITLGKLKAPKWLSLSLWVTYQVQLCSALMVTLVVWLVLAPVLHYKIKNFPKGADPTMLENLQKRTRIMYSDFAVMVHTVNLLFMLIEFAYNRLPFNKAHFPFAVMWGLAYALFAWVFHYNTGVWYYFFLDYENNLAVFGYAGLLSALYIFFKMAHVLCSAKSQFFSKPRGRKPTRSSTPSGGLASPSARAHSAKNSVGKSASPSARSKSPAAKKAAGGGGKSVGGTPGRKSGRVSKSPRRFRARAVGDD